MINYIFNRQRKTIFFLILLMFISSLFELTVVLGSGAIISSILDPSNTNNLFQNLSNYTTANRAYLGYVILVVVSSFISIYVTKRITSFASLSGISLSNFILISYLKNNIENLEINTGFILKQILDECQRFTGQILMTGLMGTSKLFTALLLFTGLAFAYPSAAFSIILLLASIYTVIFLVLKGRLEQNGAQQSDAQAIRLDAISSLLSNRIYTFLFVSHSDIFGRLDDVSKNYASVQSHNLVLTQFPKYVLEAVLFLILPVGLFLVGNSEEFIGQLAVFGFAAIKILPSVQQIYYSVATIKGNMASFEHLNSNQLHNIVSPVKPTHQLERIELLSISDERISSDEPLSFEIKTHDKVYITGRSGSGKSTLLKMILGVTTPNSGKVKFNGRYISFGEQLGFVQENFAFVEQSPSFSDGSLCDILNTERAKLPKALKLLEELELSSLAQRHDDGDFTLDTTKLSGGERQRLATVRALISNKKYIVLDEPLSALDAQSTSSTIELLNSQLDQTLIIVSHVDLRAQMQFDTVIDLC